MNSSKSGLLGYLLLFTAIFIALQIAFLIQQSGLYLGYFRLVASHITIPAAAWPDIVCFLAGQGVVHLSFTLVVWAITRLAGITLKLPWPTIQRLGFCLWGVGIFAVVLANQLYFPNSAYAGLTKSIFSDTFATFLLIPLVLICLAALFLAILGFAWWMKKRIGPLLSLLGGAILTGLIITIFWHIYLPREISQKANLTQPNVIIIGIDALRPDFIGYFNYGKPTPHINHFLNDAAVFSETITPLARTFPAWVSILTGLYPKNTGVRSDLANPKNIDYSKSLAIKLRDAGYHTIFATDETRFSNIDKIFGFDQIITPPMGLNDFLLGTANDFPLSNLIINSIIGKWLFPYSYANRPAYVTYSPDSFLSLLTPSLTKSTQQPLFLAVHFCLSHYPYLWANHADDSKNVVERYQSAITRVDQQVNDLLNQLKTAGFLKHSIVVLLSDHGEALELPGDRVTEKELYVSGVSQNANIIPHFYPPSLEREAINQSAGHGTDVLGLPQYHSVLAFKLSGFVGASQQGKLISGLTSLLDIKPTILELLNVKIDTSDGISLAALITGSKKQILPTRHYFIESDFSPQAVRTVHPEIRKVVLAGMNFFEINPYTTRITVKKSMIDIINSSKQYADVYGDWMLALYPQHQKEMVPVLVNLETGVWTTDLLSPFAQKAPVISMLNALRHFYGNEINNVSNLPQAQEKFILANSH